MLRLTPNLAMVSQYTLWFRAYSVPMCVFLGSLSARTFTFPGMWAVDSHILFSMHQSLLRRANRVTCTHMDKCCDSCGVVNHHSNMFAFKMYLKSF